VITPSSPKLATPGSNECQKHQPRVIHPAGYRATTGAKPLHQLGLPRPSCTGQNRHPLQPRR